MKHRVGLVLVAACMVLGGYLAGVPASAQRGGQGERGRGKDAGQPAQPREQGVGQQGRGRGPERRPANYPRANQGRIPPAPTARAHPGARREAERLPSGYTNDLPHVNRDHGYGREAPHDPRFRLVRAYPHGRFAHVGPSFRYAPDRVDAVHHRFWLPGGFSFEIATWDWPLCAEWCWDCGDDYVVYDDPDHPGWYLVYNVHLGVYVHAQYLGG